jgi:hypothetical protein
VLTKFGELELIEFYRAEKLAYEIWKGMATLRTLAKGAPLRVANASPWFGDDTSDELDDLLGIYDDRSRKFDTSDTGTVFGSVDVQQKPGTVFLALVNASHMRWGDLQPWFLHLGVTISSAFPQSDYPTFLWAPFDLLSYYLAHKPFGPAFQQQYRCDLESVIAVLASLLTSVFRDWLDEPTSTYRYWQRAYLGPSTRHLIAHIRENLDLGLAVVSLPIQRSLVNVEAAFDISCS